MQNPPPCAFTKKTPESEIIKSETYKIQSDNKKEYNILCENRGTLLNISTEINDEKTFKKKSFKNKFSLIDLQKVKLFQSYDSIEECLYEIDFNKGIIKEENTRLNLVIPLNSKKYPQITFPLEEKEISDSEKIQELYYIIQNLNNQVQNLQIKLDNLTYHEIKIISKIEEPTGISIDLFTFGKEDFYKYIDKNVDLIKNYYFKIFVNVKDIHKINETKQLLIEDKCVNIKEIKGTKIEIDYIIPDKTSEDEESIEWLNSFLGIKELKNIKLLFKTDLEVEDIFELEKFNDLYNKLVECQFILKGISINFKLKLLHLLDLVILKNQSNDDLMGFLFPLKIILSSKDSYIPDEKEFFNDLQRIINKLFEKSQLKAFIQFIKIGIKDKFIKAILKYVKTAQTLENINLEEITIVLPIIELEIGLFLKLKSKTFQQYIKEK